MSVWRDTTHDHYQPNPCSNHWKAFLWQVLLWGRKLNGFANSWTVSKIVVWWLTAARVKQGSSWRLCRAARKSTVAGPWSVEEVYHRWVSVQTGSHIKRREMPLTTHSHPDLYHWASSHSDTFNYQKSHWQKSTILDTCPRITWSQICFFILSLDWIVCDHGPF